MGFAIGIISISQMWYLWLYGRGIFVFLDRSTLTKEFILLISTFFLTISSVILLCFFIASFSFCNCCRNIWTLFLMTWTSSCTCLRLLRSFSDCYFSRLIFQFYYLIKSIILTPECYFINSKIFIVLFSPFLHVLSPKNEKWKKNEFWAFFKSLSEI